MRILLTSDPEIPVPPLLYGGIERIVAGLIRGFMDLGHVVGLVAHPDSSAPNDYFLPWPGHRSQVRRDTLRNMLALRRAVHEFKPDVVHSFSRLWYLATIMSSRVAKVMSFQRLPSYKSVHWANRLARGTLRFTGCSEYICRVGRQAGGDWTTIHNFVDCRRFTFVPKVREDAPLLFLSRVEAIKGPHLAIEAAQRIRRHLIIAGNHSATPSDAQYWQQKIAPRIDGKLIEYIGPVNDEQKNALLGSSVALIVPVQWDEPFGIVFAEALACGTPVITCRRGALPEIIDDNRTGLFVVTSDELSRAIARIHRLDRYLCRESAMNRFSSTAMIEKYLTFYGRCVKPSPLQAQC